MILLPSTSEIRSHGRMTKSVVIAFCTSGRRRSSPVPVVCVKSAGASTSGLGLRLVSHGLVLRADSSGGADSGGVINVMSVLCQQSNPCRCICDTPEQTYQ
jgi:hypothetical protein